jgi:pimeloyl-ACP methyl ester carboxylesterase
MLTEHTFDAEQVPISYGQGPNNGPPIVLLHGITGHRQYWDNVVPALARRGAARCLRSISAGMESPGAPRAGIDTWIIRVMSRSSCAKPSVIRRFWSGTPWVRSSR